MNRMIRMAFSLTVAGLLLAVPTAWAAETGPVVEVFSCSFNEGAGMAELDAATAFFEDQIDEIDNDALSGMDAFVWAPFKVNADLDLLWFSVYPNLNAFGSATDAMSGEAGAAVGERYDAVGDCTSSLHSVEQIYGDEDATFEDPTMIEAFRCKLHEGKGRSDVDATLDNWRGAMDSVGGPDPYTAFMMTPIASGAGYDVYYFGVHQSATDYAARSTAWLNSAPARDIDRQFSELHDCESSLWFGRQVIEGAE